MEQKEFYEVNGCEWFIPVKLIEIEEDKYTKRLEVEAIESGCRAFVPRTYKFERVEKPQKVVVPKLVAEWIETYKKKGCTLYYSLKHVFDNAELRSYIHQQKYDYTETIAKAWLAYPNIEVEPEELYTVEIPNPNLNAHVVLQKTGDGLVLVTVGNAGWAEWESSKLTEAEIKKDFDFLWTFAKHVEEK